MNKNKDVIEKVISFFKKMPKNIDVWKNAFINRRNHIFSIDEDIQRDERVIFRAMDKGELKEQEVHELLEKIDVCISELKSIQFFLKNDIIGSLLLGARIRGILISFEDSKSRMNMLKKIISIGDNEMARRDFASSCKLELDNRGLRLFGSITLKYTALLIGVFLGIQSGYVGGAALSWIVAGVMGREIVGTRPFSSFFRLEERRAILLDVIKGDAEVSIVGHEDDSDVGHTEGVHAGITPGAKTSYPFVRGARTGGNEFGVDASMKGSDHGLDGPEIKEDNSHSGGGLRR